jgi:hypothetical protein
MHYRALGKTGIKVSPLLSGRVACRPTTSIRLQPTIGHTSKSAPLPGLQQVSGLNPPLTAASAAYR